MHGIPDIDFVRLTINGSGWNNRFSASTKLALGAKDFDGVVRTQIDHPDSTTKVLIWNMILENVRYKMFPSLFPVAARFSIVWLLSIR